MITLVTGATAGFGLATAHIYAKNGYDVIITGRRNKRLQELSNELKEQYGVKVLALNFDVRELKEVESAIASLSEEWKKIDILVNNAGLAVGLSSVQEGVIDDWERMIDTNIKGLLYMTRLVSPLMIENGSGHIINIGSIAAKDVYANGAVYCSTKHAVEALNKGMRIDLLPHNIRVTAIHPGMAETEFSLVRFKGNEEKAKTVYEGIKPLSAEDIAETIYWTSTRPTHVNISDLLITATAQPNPMNTLRSDSK